MSRRGPALLLAVVLFTALPAAGAGLPEAVTRSLLEDIRTAQDALTAEADRGRARAEELGRRVAERSARLEALREEAAVLRRRSDERLLGLEALEDRLREWRAQDTYRRSLLGEFADRRGAVEEDGLEVLQTALAELEGSLAPAPETHAVVTASGALEQVRTLRLGPARWFSGVAGVGLLLEDRDGTLRVAQQLDGAAADAVRRLFDTGAGRAPLDPTGGQLLRSAGGQRTLLAHVRAGGIWVLPILAFAGLASLIAVAKALQFLRLPRLAPVPPEARLAPRGDGGERAWERRLAPPQRRLRELAGAAADAEERDDLCFGFLSGERRRLERFLGLIAVTATVSPLLGLLGTVSGMISTFTMMQLFGSGDASVVSGGISEALVTTELGLVVAIPALLVHALLQRRASGYLQELEATAIAFGDRAQPTAEATPGEGR